MLQEELTQEQVPEETKPPRPTFGERLLAREGIIAYLPVIVVVILMFMGASWQFTWLHTDAARYQCYSLTFWLGGGASRLLPGVQCAYLPHSSLIAPPFHALPLEYPPLTLLVFTPALLAPLVYYQMTFAILMALMAVFMYWLLLRDAPRGAALAFAAYMLIGAWATAEARFDLVPAALTLICVIAAHRKHWTFAYIALAMAFLLKIYPLLFLPALFIAEQQDARRFFTPQQSVTLASLPVEVWRTLRGLRHWRWKNTLIFFALLLGVTGLFALLDFQGAVLSQLSYFANRPVQVEASASPILFLAAHFGVAGHTAYTFGSINIVSPLGEPVSLVFDVLLVLGYLYTLSLQWRGKLEIPQAFIAILLVFIVTGKVFSPQYLMWLMPLLVYTGAYTRFWLLTWGLISLLTTIIYPYLYTRTLDGTLAPYLPGFVQSVAARDALLVFLTLAYLFNWWRIRTSRNTINAASA
ncbi:MAG TPA: hypothetical protein VIZ18_07900 [Ktedonobacteraceae bacterium]